MLSAPIYRSVSKYEKKVMIVILTNLTKDLFKGRTKYIWSAILRLEISKETPQEDAKYKLSFSGFSLSRRLHQCDWNFWFHERL